MYFLLNGRDWGGVTTATGNAFTTAFAVATAIPWGRRYFKLLKEMTYDPTDTGVGPRNSVRDKISLKAVYEHIQAGRMDEAEEELQMIHRANPNASEPLFVLATLAHGRPDLEEEEKYFREIVGNDKFLVDARVNAAASLLDLMKDTSADEADIQRVQGTLVRLTAERKQIYEPEKSAAYKLKNEHRGGKRAPSSSDEKENPQAYEFDLHQARRHASRGEFEAAVPLLKSYIADNPDVPRNYFELVSLFERQERFDDAILWLQKIVSTFREHDSAWGDAMLRIAGIRERADGDIDAAIAALEAVNDRLKYANHGKLARIRLAELRKAREES